MKTISAIESMQSYSQRARRRGQRIGLVPTMGSLHDGHLALIAKARELADIVVVSIFVNPTQFGPNEDLAGYPRDFEADRDMCESHGVDVVFAPAAADMYAADHSVWVSEERLSGSLCGKSRPGHFRGVATVVAKLFNITLPDVAVFGQKDAQQALIIRRLVRDLNFPLEILIVPTVREKNGLAMSSRNRYLSPEEREAASVICRELDAAEIKLKNEGSGTLDHALENISRAIRAEGGIVDYVTALDADNLEKVSLSSRAVLLAVAARFGKARLIDNILVNIPAGTES